jgi:hypothetical protein
LAFTDHYFDGDALQEISRGIKSGSTPQLTDALRANLTPGVQEAKRLLGINRVKQPPRPQSKKRGWPLSSWFKRGAKERGNQNELDVLEETVREHERGRHDNTEYIKKQMAFIERDHKRTPEVQRLLERARRAIEN